MDIRMDGMGFGDDMGIRSSEDVRCVNVLNVGSFAVHFFLCVKTRDHIRVILVSIIDYGGVRLLAI